MAVGHGLILLPTMFTIISTADADAVYIFPSDDD